MALAPTFLHENWTNESSIHYSFWKGTNSWSSIGLA